MADQKTNQPYEAPELLELGKAETLTLGGKGCGHDNDECEHAIEELNLF